MANQLFKNFPEVQYKLSNGKFVTIKDFFRKAKLEGTQLNQVVDYTVYELQEGERPDVVASKLYGNGDLHWTLFLANDITNYYDWYMDSNTFEEVIHKKYPGQVLVASVSTDIVSATSKFLIGEDITQNTVTGKIVKVDPTYNRIWVERTNGKDFVANQVVNTVRTIDGAVAKSFTPTSVKNGVDATAYYYDPSAGGINSYRYNHNVTGTYQPRTYYEKEYEDNEARRKIKVIRPEFIRRVVSEFERVMSA